LRDGKSAPARLILKAPKKAGKMRVSLPYIFLVIFLGLAVLTVMTSQALL